MKKKLIIMASVILAGAAGIWVGTNITPPIMFRNYGLFVTDGGGEYPKEVFARINEEIPQKITGLVGWSAGQDHMVVVTPELSGYKVYMAGPFKSSFWDENTQKNLSDWIYTRMDALEQKYRKLHPEKPSKASEAIGAPGAPQPQR